MKNIIAIIFLLIFSNTLISQVKEYSFTMNEAIDFALENNRIVKNAYRDIEAAEKLKWETTAIGLPQLNASIDYQNWIKQMVSLFPAAAFDPHSQIRDLGDYYNVIPNPNNPIPDAPEGFVPVIFGTKQNLNASATLTQLIFDGSYLVGLQSAKVFLEISINAKEKTDLEIRKSVISAYSNVLISEEGIDILENNKTVLKKNLNETVKIFENGMAEEESVEQLQITLSNIEISLNNAIRLKLIAYQMLNISLGLDLNTPLVIKENLEELVVQNINFNLLKSTSDEYANNIDYKIAQNDKESKELMLKLEKSKYLPSLSAFINGGYIANNDAFAFMNSDQKWYGSSLFGLSMNIPVFSSLGRNASTQRAKIELDKAEENLTETEQKLKLEIATAKSNYEFTIQRYQTSKLNLDLAERIETKNQTKYFEGITTSFDLRQAQIQLYSSQQDYLKAMIDVINSKAELETVLNKIAKIN